MLFLFSGASDYAISVQSGLDDVRSNFLNRFFLILISLFLLPGMQKFTSELLYFVILPYFLTTLTNYEKVCLSALYHSFSLSLSLFFTFFLALFFSTCLCLSLTFTPSLSTSTLPSLYLFLYLFLIYLSFSIFSQSLGPVVASSSGVARTELPTLLAGKYLLSMSLRTEFFSSHLMVLVG